ncbi:MAG TPA: tetratricopeptide repeat protein, partial [Candidatus Udaeobacter sp.]|nr:tetratricopeptide repeat protein [Candidatus Udaeobacter sp.]
EVSEVVTAEIAPEVARAARQFAVENYGVLDSPKHRLVHADGRHYLRASRACFDVILAEPPPPRASSTTHLYSREYYLACRDALHPGGYCLQWMPLHSQGDQELRAKLATFLEVFPQSSVWLPNGEEAIILGVAPGGPNPPPGSPTGLAIEPNMLRARMADPAVAPALAEVGLATPEDLLGCFLFGPEALARYTRDQPILTDRHPFAQATIDYPRLLDPFDLMRLISLREPAPITLASGAEAQTAARDAVAEMVRGQILDHPAQLFEAERLAPGNRYFLQLCLADSVQLAGLTAELAQKPDPDLALLRTQGLATRDQEAECLAAMTEILTRYPERPTFRLAAARIALHLGDPTAGINLLSAVPPDSASRQANEAATSFLALAMASESATGAAQTVAANDYLEVLMATREYGLARQVAHQLYRDAPQVPRNVASLALALDASGYPERAAAVYEQIAGLAPDDPGLSRARGRALFYAQQVDQAEPLLAKSAERDPRDVDVQRLHAEALRELGRYPEAERAIGVLVDAPDPADRLLAAERTRVYRLLAETAARRSAVAKRN